MNLAAVDRSFIATNVRRRDVQGPDGASNALCRFEFLEVVVRIGAEKFRSPGLVKTFAEATEKLITEFIMPNFKMDMQW